MKRPQVKYLRMLVNKRRVRFGPVHFDGGFAFFGSLGETGEVNTKVQANLVDVL